MTAFSEVAYDCRMRVVQPIFYLNHSCPVCEQGDSLAFFSCPRCGAVIIECLEEGTIFFDPKNLSHSSDSSRILCPQCQTVKIADFKPSTEEQIQAVDFTTNDYH